MKPSTILFLLLVLLVPIVALASGEAVAVADAASDTVSWWV
jgi:hypothetical protein